MGCLAGIARLGTGILLLILAAGLLSCAPPHIVAGTSASH